MSSRRSINCKINIIEGLTGSGKTFKSITKCVSFYKKKGTMDCCIMACYSFQALIDVLLLFSNILKISYKELSENLNSKVLIFNRHFVTKDKKFDEDIRVIFTTHSCISKSGDSPLLNEFMTYVLYLSLKKKLHLIIDESLHFFSNLEWHFKLYKSSNGGEKIPIYHSYKLNEYNVYIFSEIVLKDDLEYSFYDYLHYISDIDPNNIVSIKNYEYKSYTNNKIFRREIFKKIKNHKINNYCIDKGFNLMSISECSADKAINYFFKGSSQLIYLKRRTNSENISYISGMDILIIKLYVSLFESIDFISSSYPTWVFSIFIDLNLLYKYTILDSKPVIDKGSIFLIDTAIPTTFIKNISELRDINTIVFCRNKKDLNYLVKDLRIMRCDKFQFFLEGIQTTSQVSNTYSKLEEPKKAPL
jgi:hypothetical protein